MTDGASGYLIVPFVYVVARRTENTSQKNIKRLSTIEEERENSEDTACTAGPQ